MTVTVTVAVMVTVVAGEAGKDGKVGTVKAVGIVVIVVPVVMLVMLVYVKMESGAAVGKGVGEESVAAVEAAGEAEGEAAGEMGLVVCCTKVPPPSALYFRMRSGRYQCIVTGTTGVTRTPKSTFGFPSPLCMGGIRCGWRANRGRATLPQ